MKYVITEEIENYFEDKNIEFAVGSLLLEYEERLRQGKDKITPKYAVMQVFNLSSKKAKLCLRLVEEIKTLSFK